MSVSATSGQGRKGSIGQRIAKARDSYGLSQAELGANLDVTRAAVSQYEQDKIRPRPQVIDRLAEFFNSDPEWFEHGRGKAPDPLNAPLTLKEINPANLLTQSLRDLASGREWRLPVATFAGVKLSAHDHMVVIVAPNAAGPVHRGDRVVIDTSRKDGEGSILLVVSEDAGAQLLTATALAKLDGRRNSLRIIGRVIAYLRTL